MEATNTKLNNINEIEQITFDLITKTLPQEGNLAYEYNAFRNYRINEPKFLYNNKLYNKEELSKYEGIYVRVENGVIKYYRNKRGEGNSATYYNEVTYNKPEFYEKGELIDFDTDELSFNLKHPVQILPQYSYDGSVNLIINDGLNQPRLINSRFSPLGKNKYQIVDRKGDADTNIYDEGLQFDIDTSLYKRTIEIPSIKYSSVQYGGNLSIGNYHFYFKYADADGNETDFVGESGLVSIFIGNTPESIRSGFRNESSNKLIKFTIKNIDSAYQYVNVYFTRATGDINENETVNAFRIESKYLVRGDSTCLITITGFEETTEIPLTDLNLQYETCSSVETQTSAQNMLFFGNVIKPEINYKELTDISLRFLPYINIDEDYTKDIEYNYTINSNNKGYYDSKYIYEKTGYWYDELYRFGVVYIMSDNTLSPVFNVRGKANISNNSNNYTNYSFYIDGDQEKRNYISYREDNFELVPEIKEDSTSIIQYLENAKGVFSIKLENSNENKITNPVIGIKFKIISEAIDYLKNKLKIKGFFFVRQKRIPTTLCQAFTIGIDPESNTPVIPIEGNKFITESFLTHGEEERLLTNNFKERVVELSDAIVRKQAAICPDYDINSPYYNSLFTGSDFTICESKIRPNINYFRSDNFDNRNHYIRMGDYAINDSESFKNVKIIGVEDNVKLVGIDKYKFSARAGEAEEAFRYEYIESENKITEATNLLRGSFGPYLAIIGYENSGRLIDIKIPGFSKGQIPEYFKIRYNDKSSYYAVSDRISLNKLDEYFKETDKNLELNTPLYRGDCYICQFTHRINRNFQDPSAPTNDKIVDKYCWKDNYSVTDGVVSKENFDKINLGDVNAVPLGMWVTFTVRSNYNLNIRNIDDSIPDEEALTGHPRGFYPYHPMSVSGTYKTPEALCYNKGFGRGLSERQNFEVPDVPAIKNDFTNRILYSDIHITDAFQNGFRVFRGQHYRDYPKTYGQIIKLIELGGNLLCVFEHGIALIAVNERTVAGEGAGGNVFINTSNVLPENPKIISDTFGSQWKESVIKTPAGVYGVDTVGKKIWYTNGDQFKTISDFSVQEFLNNNISLTERELEPIIGIRNVKTHYNNFKGDVMFTFYDNLYGFEEKVWNLCWNERIQKWVTFYSWVPSYSENIYNQYFSFNRNTSKWIAKLGISKHDNDFSDGVTLTKNIIEPYNGKEQHLVGELQLDNRNLPSGDGVIYDIDYSLERDIYKNYEYFKIWKDPDTKKSYLYIRAGKEYTDLCSELYVRGSKDDDGKFIENSLITNPKDNLDLWKQNCVKGNYLIYKDDSGRRKHLVTKGVEDNRINPNRIVWLLNIRAKITVDYTGQNPELGEAMSQGFANGVEVNGTQYESVVAVIPKYNLQFLSTDFWKHGQAGIIDIADDIYPTYWYGEQHPFEFEFVVADNPNMHKIFDSLELISNKAAPESFHYEIIGECYDFAKDKKNMYIRQEATKELYQYNGVDIEFDRNYKKLDSRHRPICTKSDGTEVFDRSTIFPLYYYRQKRLNEIQDYYTLYGYQDEYEKYMKNFSALAGAEIVRYKNLDEYRIWNHAKAVDVKEHGLLRGNMQYKEDKWRVQINPLNLVYKNEPNDDWKNKFKLHKTDVDTYDMVPAELNHFNCLDSLSEVTSRPLPSASLNLPPDWERNIIKWGDYEKLNKEVKLKDKYIKIRIRYSGEDLAIISAINTMYSISYS